jgi:methylated-DNA-[protein]-cysteine S-methyltransferase
MLNCTEVTIVDGLTVRLVTGVSGVRSIDFEPFGVRHDTGPAEDTAETPVAREIAGEAVRQLRAYFAGQLRRFDLPLDLQGTDFQMRVWRELERIPYGETRSYLQMATAIGSPRAVRAVGAANGANPIPIVVPCHRVIGAGGRLVGYGGGLPLKKRLLQLEGAWALPLRY